jgi:hypothetical protein
VLAAAGPDPHRKNSIRAVSLQTVPPRADEQSMLDSALAALLICSLLPATACAHSGSAPTSAPMAATTSAEGHVALESWPSPAAAALLPTGARYRMVATAREIALVVVGADDRIAGRLRIQAREQARDRANAGYGSTITLDDFGGPTATIDAWSSAGGLCGAATVGDRHAAWQVRVDADGSLAGEHWSVRHVSASRELTELRRARAIGADLAALATELIDSGALASTAERELTELVVLADLALELSVRAWDGRRRASLPRVTNVVDAD